jgi:hypothetical protein
MIGTAEVVQLVSTIRRDFKVNKMEIDVIKTSIGFLFNTPT